MTCNTGFAAPPAPGATDDAFTQFSYTKNPNGVWSYGYTTGLGGPFTLYNQSCDLADGLKGWQMNCSGPPEVVKNISGVDYVTDSYFPATDYLGFHPGPSGEYSTIRWTAPTKGEYQINAAFTSLRLNYCGVSTDVYVIVNGVEYFNAFLYDFFTVDGNYPGTPAPPKTFATILTLETGSTVDFVVGDGDNEYYCDGSGVKASILTNPPHPYHPIPPIHPPHPIHPPYPVPPVCTK